MQSEDFDEAARSALDMRRVLTDEIGKRPIDNQGLTPHLKMMRGACRRFLDDIANYVPQNWAFYAAVGQLRATFGIHIAQISVNYKLDVEDQLESILPPLPE